MHPHTLSHGIKVDFQKIFAQFIVDFALIFCYNDEKEFVMAYNGEGVAALVSIIDELQTVNLILADKKVKELLKCLAFYPEFRAVLSKVNQGFDYQGEKKKALQRV